MIALQGEGPSLQCLFARQTVCLVAIMTAERDWLLLLNSFTNIIVSTL